MQHLKAMLLGLALASAASGGELVTFSFSGRITRGVPGLGIHLNDPWHGTYTFDPGSADSDPGVDSGVYRSSASSLALTLGDFDLSTQGTTSRILLYNTGTYDRYSIGAFDFSSGGYDISELSVSLIDPSGHALSSTTLTALPPRLSDFPTRSLSVQGASGSFIIEGTVDLLTPEPGSLVLFFAAIGFCGLRGRRR